MPRPAGLPRPDESAIVEGLLRRVPGGVVWRAPGRVNIVGEHVDYTGGLVLPLACDRYVYLAAVASHGPVVLESLSEPEPAVLDLDAEPAAATGWTRYVAGVAAALREAGMRPHPVRGVIDSTIPAGAGLSSSAALEAAVALALLDGVAPEPQVLQRAEHLAVGVPCGVMDQVATLHGRAGHAILLDCADVTWHPVRIPESLELLVADTGTRRRLDDGRYAARRTEVEEALSASAQLGAAGPRELEPADLERLQIDDLRRRRLRHVVTENRRVVLAAAALGDGDAAGLGRLVDESHRSLREDFEVSSPGLDAAVAALRAAPGCLGARLLGGGFAGCVLAVVEAGASPAVWRVASVDLPEATAIPVTAVDGAAALGV